MTAACFKASLYSVQSQVSFSARHSAAAIFQLKEASYKPLIPSHRCEIYIFFTYMHFATTAVTVAADLCKRIELLETAFEEKLNEVLDKVASAVR